MRKIIALIWNFHLNKLYLQTEFTNNLKAIKGMRRTILILLLCIIGNGLLLLGTDFKPTIPIITLQIMSFWGTYKLIKDSNLSKKKEKNLPN